MKLIPLRARDGSVRAYAKVDDEDAAWASGYGWFLHSEGYARRNEGHSSAYMHVEIAARAGIIGAAYIDHVNEDKLDNQRGNLRAATPSLNGCNQTRHRNARGYSYDKRNDSWKVQLRLAPDTPRIRRTFGTEYEAAEFVRVAREERHATSQR